MVVPLQVSYTAPFVKSMVTAPVPKPLLPAHGPGYSASDAMKTGSVFTRFHHRALRISLAVLMVAILTECVAILLINSGFFVYTLDDPYIHLALAENIVQGHYGINAGEYSAPSSTILWPFILAPLAGSMLGAYVPLLINILAAIGTLVVFVRILERSMPDVKPGLRPSYISLFAVLLMLATNTIGLIFTGMEHSLQLFLCVTIVWGLILEADEQKLTGWLPWAIVAAPLIRYECLTISLVALVYLWVRGYYRQSALSTTAIVILVGGFSLFLVKLGLEPLPTSVLAKSSVVSDGGAAGSVLDNLKANLAHSRGAWLALAMLLCITFAFVSRRNARERLLAGTGAVAIGMHLLLGQHGWYNRYEIYIWAAAVLILVYIGRGWLARGLGHATPVKATAVATLWVLVIAAPYMYDLLTLPVASSNIYEQHYQMHRFAVDYYDGPVAVNDLGYVSYQNPKYVLDLGGLTSLEVLHLSRASADPEWMNRVSAARDVQLAMIYDRWFESLSANWRKVGELQLGRSQITASQTTVSFYALTDEAYARARGVIDAFRSSLPRGVTFRIAE